jgi:hypothetical protein
MLTINIQGNAFIHHAMNTYGDKTPHVLNFEYCINKCYKEWFPGQLHISS